MRRFGKFSVESYGQLPGGEVVWLVRLRADSGLQAEVLTLGATLHSLNVPTDSGSVDVVLGKLSLEGYLQNGLCNSSVIGRCANRIEGGTFTLNGRRVQLERNFGGGWDSLSQSIQDIIESGFDISTTTLPKDRLHKPGGMYEKKINDGFEVLEIPKGAWVEAIFAKEKPEMEKPEMHKEDSDLRDKDYDDEDDDEEDDLPDSKYGDDEDEDDFDEDKLTEESYRTTFDTDPEDLYLEAEDVTDDDDN